MKKKVLCTLLATTMVAGMFAGCVATQLGKIVGLPAHLVLSLYEWLGDV